VVNETRTQSRRQCQVRSHRLWVPALVASPALADNGCSLGARCRLRFSCRRSSFCLPCSVLSLPLTQERYKTHR
jgi:hypothetical protein